MMSQPINEESQMVERESNRIIRLSNGDTFEFPVRFKGKHRRGMERIRGSFEKVEDYTEHYPEMIELFTEKIYDQNGKEIIISNNYLDELSLEDYEDLITNGVEEFFLEMALKKKR